MKNLTNIAEKMDIVPTWLYVKQHNKTGLKYFGKTTSDDPVKYVGSGKYWKRHLKKNGNDVSTIWAHQFTGQEDITNFALLFSELNNIVESTDWANLIPENGIDGNCKGHIPWNLGKTNYLTMEAKKKMSETHKGQIPWCLGKHHSAESNRKNSAAHIGKTQRLGAKLTDKSKKLMSEKAQTRTKIECEHCLRFIDPSPFSQYHGDKCKQNPNRIIDINKIERIRIKQSNSAKNRKTRRVGNYYCSDSFRKEQAERTRNLPKKECPHCGKLASPANFIKWHNENCPNIRNSVNMNRGKIYEKV